MLGNALELPQDDTTLDGEVGIAIQIIEGGEVIEDFTNIHKRMEIKSKADKIAANYATMFRRTYVIRDRLIQPRFRLYLAAERALLDRLEDALVDPARPLYLGESDDIVIVSVRGRAVYEPVTTTTLDSIALGVLAGGEVVYLPVAFHARRWGKYDCERAMYTVGRHLMAEEPIEAYEIGDAHVVFDPTWQ